MKKLFQHVICTLTHPIPTRRDTPPGRGLIFTLKEGTKRFPFKGGARFIGWGMSVFFLVSLFLLQPSLLSAQDFTTTIHKTAHFQNADNIENELRVYNINGPVTVEGYDGDEIQVTAEEQIDGNDEEVQRAKDELHFKVERWENKVLVYLDAPFTMMKKYNGHINYNVNRNNNDGDSYEFLFNIHIRVPRHANVHASTINHGELSVSNTSGKVFASNINGGVKLDHISGETNARTINGKITASYDKSPSKDSEYHTINGKIEVYYPQNLSADIRFKSMHGDLYTDFNDVKRLNAQVKSDKKSSGRKTIYHVDRFSPIRIGSGGPTFNFKVLNGDVYIKQIKS